MFNRGVFYMQIDKLHKDYDKMQKIYGSKNLKSIYGAGQINNPDVCFVFMNPTGRNIASEDNWKGLRAPWIGTKNIWKLFNKIGMLDDKLAQDIENKKPADWNEAFAEEVYNYIKNKNVYITNLAKCTQTDAKHLKDSVFKEYLSLLEEEIKIINPKIIITFGNQVSSVFLEEAISVSKCRKQKFNKKIGSKSFEVYPVYYPVGQGMRNISTATEDIKFILCK